MKIVLLFLAVFFMLAKAQCPGSLPSSCSGRRFKLARRTISCDLRRESLFDLDIRDIETSVDAGTDSNNAGKFSAAKRVYSNGKNAKPFSLRKLSTVETRKMKKEGYFKLYERYFRSRTYADKFVSAALRGSGQFAGTAVIFRAECILKGCQYQHVWMYVIHLMEQGVCKCKARKLDDALEYWDRAWAFYCGHTPGTRGQCKGWSLWDKAEKRCAQFGTCSSSSIAEVNKIVIALFNRGVRLIGDRDCDGLLADKNDIVEQLVVPQLKGVKRYVVSTDRDLKLLDQAKKMGKPAAVIKERQQAVDKSHAEGWAFLNAVLPMINFCNTASASLLVRNFKPSANPPLPDGTEKTAKAIYKVLGCLGLKCKEIGSPGQLRMEGLPACRTSGSKRIVPLTNRPAC